MKPSFTRALSVALLLLAAVAAGGAFLQRETAAALEREIALLKEDNQRIAALRAEQVRLQAQQVPPAELERLRADRGAVLRLRAEVEALRDRVEQRAKSVSAAGR
jgi:hypothetical protein